MNDLIPCHRIGNKQGNPYGNHPYPVSQTNFLPKPIVFNSSVVPFSAIHSNFKASQIGITRYIQRIGSAFTTSPTVKAQKLPKLFLVRDITENFHLRNPRVVIIPLIVKTAVKGKTSQPAHHIYFMYLHDIHFNYPTIEHSFPRHHP